MLTRSMTHKSRLDTRLPVIAGVGTNRIAIAIDPVGTNKKPGTGAGFLHINISAYMPSRFGSPSEMNGT